MTADRRGDDKEKVKDIGHGSEIEAEDLDTMSGGVAGFRRFVGAKEEPTSPCVDNCELAQGKTGSWESVES